MTIEIIQNQLIQRFKSQLILAISALIIAAICMVILPTIAEKSVAVGVHVFYGTLFLIAVCVIAGRHYKGDVSYSLVNNKIEKITYELDRLKKELKYSRWEKVTFSDNKALVSEWTNKVDNLKRKIGKLEEKLPILQQRSSQIKECEINTFGKFFYGKHYSSKTVTVFRQIISNI